MKSQRVEFSSVLPITLAERQWVKSAQNTQGKKERRKEGGRDLLKDGLGST